MGNKDDENYDICELSTDNLTFEEILANARLIAAAPELLEACKAMCGMIYRDKNNDERIDLDQYEEAESLCRLAIAKAEGQQ